eukprot:972808_1
MAGINKKFVQRFYILAVWVVVVMHSLPVGVLGSSTVSPGTPSGDGGNDQAIYDVNPTELPNNLFVKWEYVDASSGFVGKSYADASKKLHELSNLYVNLGGSTVSSLELGVSTSEFNLYGEIASFDSKVYWQWGKGVNLVLKDFFNECEKLEETRAKRQAEMQTEMKAKMDKLELREETRAKRQAEMQTEMKAKMDKMELSKIWVKWKLEYYSKGPNGFVQKSQADAFKQLVELSTRYLGVEDKTVSSLQFYVATRANGRTLRQISIFDSADDLRSCRGKNPNCLKLYTDFGQNYSKLVEEEKAKAAAALKKRSSSSGSSGQPASDSTTNTTSSSTTSKESTSSGSAAQSASDGEEDADEKSEDEKSEVP